MICTAGISPFSIWLPDGITDAGLPLGARPGSVAVTGCKVRVLEPGSDPLVGLAQDGVGLCLVLYGKDGAPEAAMFCWRSGGFVSCCEVERTEEAGGAVGMVGVTWWMWPPSSSSSTWIWGEWRERGEMG